MAAPQPLVSMVTASRALACWSPLATTLMVSSACAVAPDGMMSVVVWVTSTLSMSMGCDLYSLTVALKPVAV